MLKLPETPQTHKEIDLATGMRAGNIRSMFPGVRRKGKAIK